MCYKVITKYILFGREAQEEKTSDDAMDISPLPSPKTKFLPIDSTLESLPVEGTSSLSPKKVTISEFMNNKIDEPEIAIEKLKKDLEKKLLESNY